MATTDAEQARPGRRERRRRDIRLRILAAALEMFREQGYAKTSVDVIADRADVARTTLFNYFPRKQDLLIEWAGERRDRLSALAAEDAANARTAASTLRRQFDLLAAENEADVALAIVLVQGWLAEVSELAAVFPVFASFRDAVAAGQRSGEFTDAVSADAISEILTTTYTDTLGRWVQPQASGGLPPFPLHAALRGKLQVILSGVSVREHAGQ